MYYRMWICIGCDFDIIHCLDCINLSLDLEYLGLAIVDNIIYGKISLIHPSLCSLLVNLMARRLHTTCIVGRWSNTRTASLLIILVEVYTAENFSSEEVYKLY